MKSLKNLLLSTFIFTFTFISCEEPTSSNSESNNASVTLTVADVSCTEAWLRVTAEGVNFNNGAELTLYRDDTVRSSFPIYSADTVIYDEGLLPSKTYRYTAKLTFTPTQTNGSVTKESNTTEAVTMDTTSHEFTWEVYTFGGAHGSSGFSDVAIINENDIWAVGEIHTEDTDQWNEDSTEWIQPYNAVHWNGEEWELKRLLFYTDQDHPEYGTTPYPCESAFLINENELLVTSNVQTMVINQDGESRIIRMGFAWEDRFTINSLWGVSSDDFYVVGNGGNIAHYKNGTWTKVESGTEMNFYDIWGDFNEVNGEYEIYAVATDYHSEEHDYGLLEIKGNGVINKIIGTPPQGEPYWYGVWFDAPFKYYIAGLDLWETVKLSSVESWRLIREFGNRAISRIEGDGLNNVWATGAYGEIMKFNGIRWKSYRDIIGEYEGFSKAAVKGNLTVAVTAGGYVAKIVVIKEIGK